MWLATLEQSLAKFTPAMRGSRIAPHRFLKVNNGGSHFVRLSFLKFRLRSFTQPIGIADEQVMTKKELHFWVVPPQS